MDKIGILGLGYWGKNILRNLLELGCEVTACDLNRDILQLREQEFPQVTYVNDLAKIYQDQSIKSVVIATPASTHHALVRRALECDKDVFVEKPLALRYSEGKELVDLAQSKKKILMVGHILHYHPAVIRLKAMIKQGDLGQVQYIYSNRLNIGKLRTEENILWSFAPHDISLILSLVGQEPISVRSFGQSYLNEGIYDTTVTHLEFKNKVRAHVFVSWLHPFKEQKLVVVGSKAMAVFDDVGKNKLLIYPHKIEWTDGKIPVAQKAECITLDVPEAEPLQEELKHFFSCVGHRVEPITNGVEGLKVLKVLNDSEHQEPEHYFIHPTATVDEPVQIGQGSKIWHYSHVLKNSKIGDGCVLGQNTSLGPDVSLGNRVKIQNNVSVYKGVTIEDDVFCGPSCVFTNVYTPRSFIERKDEFLPTLVKKGATIGANATILCGVTIGKYALIGAGSVVKKDVPDYALVVGVPAVQKGWVCKCGVPLGKSKFLTCKNCRSQYKVSKNNLVVIQENV